jgi:PKD repeat protein
MPLLLRADCSLTSTGTIPLNDLGPGTYQGFTAGLYPAGFDMPPTAHAAAALTIATDQIKPLNPSGNPDPVNGRIVMISIGMSNTTQEFATKGTQNFKLRADPDPAKNPQLVIVDGAQGGQDAPAWINPNATTWSILNQRLAAAGVAPEQVQVAWLKQALAGPNNYGAFPAHAQALQADLEIIVRNLKTKFPNIKITYLSPRTRAYTNTLTALNPEPFAYETGFAVKWTIEDQITGAGNLNFDPAKGAVVAPLILWGPYIWADGLTPRSDGFTWLCSDLESDFTHPSASGGVPKVGAHLLAFFKTDPTAVPWFLKRTVTGQPPQVTAGASVSSGPPPLSVNFMASASDPDGTIAAYQWTFDDGTFSTAQNPAKTFPAPGNYSVRLTVTDDSGNTTLRTLPISVVPAQSSPTPTSTPSPASPTPTPASPTPTPASPTPTPATTPTATPTPTTTPIPTATPSSSPAAQPLNLSTRMRVQTGDDVGIGGFIITGSAPQHVVLRAVLPRYVKFDLLYDPVLELHGPGAFTTITNDNWRDDPVQAAAILATGLAPIENSESAIDATLNPGLYTAVVRGKNNTSGIGLVEVYDLSQTVDSKLANISTRAFVGTNANIVIAGFILGGNSGVDRIVVRGIGPSLSAVGVPNALANPTLELRNREGALLIRNNDWQDDPAQAAEISAAGLAPSSNLEAAIAASLSPGPYTVLLYGANNSTGVGLVEVYDRGAP